PSYPSTIPIDQIVFAAYSGTTWRVQTQLVMLFDPSPCVAALERALDSAHMERAVGPALAVADSPATARERFQAAIETYSRIRAGAPWLRRPRDAMARFHVGATPEATRVCAGAGSRGCE